MLTEKKNSKHLSVGNFHALCYYRIIFYVPHRGETQFNTITVGVGAVQLATSSLYFTISQPS